MYSHLIITQTKNNYNHSRNLNKIILILKCMNKKIDERPVFPFTSIVGQEEICDLKSKYYENLI